MSPSATPTASPAPTETATYIVIFRAWAGFGDVADALSAAGATVVGQIPELRMAIVTLPAADAVARAAGLAADPAVLHVDRDKERATEGAPSDPLYPDQWSLRQIGWEAAHDGPAPAGHAVVAILDTGVDASHPDLAGHLLPGTSFVAGDPPDQDPNGHGTWMAGIVAADTDNNQGIAGVAWSDVKVLPVTVLGPDGTGVDSDIVAGIVAATDAGADVILMSFSAKGYSAALQAAIDYAWAHDVVVVAATGNDGSTAATYPAGDRGAVGVSSTDRSDRLAPGSNSGPSVFIAAPGVDVETTDAGGGYTTISGTSAAAAEVAGAAAVLRAADPAAANGTIVGRLARTAAAAGTQDQTGNGRLDLARALSDAGTAQVEPTGVAGAADGGPFVGPYVAAAVRTWTGGGGDNNWSTPANWGGTAPVAGDDLVFPGGAARLTNTNDFPAGTSFNSITISDTGYTLSGNSVALGTGNLLESAAGASNTINLALSFAATDTVSITDAGATLTLGGVISGAGGLVKNGSGTLILSAANTYTGATTLSAGVILARTNAALGTAAGTTTVASGAVLGIDGSGLAIAEPVTLNGSGSGAGVLRNLANSNTWSGAITLASDSMIGSTAGTFTVSAAIATAGFVVAVDGAGNTTKSVGPISGTGGLTQTATGTLTVSVASTYTGATTISAGTFKLGVANGIGASSALTVAAGATFDLAGFGDTLGSLAGAGTVTDGSATAATLTCGGNNTSTTFSGTLAAGAGTLSLAKTGAGTLVLSGANTYTGATTVSVGVLRVQSNAALGSTAGATSVTSGAELDVDGSGLSIAEPISTLNGTGIAAAGALRNLANDNTWSGVITMAAASRINSDGGTLTLSGAIAGAFGLTVGGAGNTAIGGVIGTAAGTLTKDGAGTLTLSAAATYTGATTVSGGVLKLGVVNAVGASSALSVAAGATFDLAGFSEAVGSLAGAGNVTSSAAGAVTLTSGGLNTASTTYSGTASDGSGTLAMTKVGTGTLILSGANTYTGATAINAGTLQLNSAGALGTSNSSTTVASGATLQFANSITTTNTGMLFLNGTGATGSGALLNVSGNNRWNSDITIASNTTLYSSTAGNTLYVGSAAYGTTLFQMGSTTVTTDGPGDVWFDANVGVSGDTGSFIKNGTGKVTFYGYNTFYTGPTFVNNGMLDLIVGPFSAGIYGINGALTIGDNVGAAGSAIANIASNTYAGQISPSSAVTINSDGMLQVALANSIGSLTFNGGQISLNAITLSLTGNVTSNVNSAHQTALISGGTLGLGGARIFTVDRDATLTSDLTISSPITGGSITKQGTGVLTLSGTNTLTGTTINAGTINAQATNALGTTNNATVATGATLQLQGGFSFGQPSTTLNGTGTAGNGALENVSGNNTLTGPVTIASATRIQSDAGTLTASGTVALGASTLNVGGAGNTTLSGVVSGTGGLTKDGTGTWIVSGNNSYTGATTINAGTLSVNSLANLSSSSALGAPTTVANGTINIGSTTTGATLQYTGSGSTTNRAINLAGTTGGTMLDSSGAGALNFTSAFTATGAGSKTLTLTGSNTNANTISGAIVNNSAANITSLVKNGVGTWVLSGANTFTGATTLNGGLLSIGADNGLGTAPGAATANQLVFNGGTLGTTGTFTLNANRGATLNAGGGTFDVGAGTTLTYGGIIAGASTLTKTGSGTLVLSGTNTYAGVTTLSAGALRLQSNAALGSSAGATTVASGAELDIDGSALVIAEPVTLSGTGIAAAGALRNLANANTWSGAVTLAAASRINSDAGTLTLAGIGGATFALTIGGSGNTTVGGVVGTTTGTLTKDGSGTLTLSAANTYTGATTLNAGVISIGADNNLGTAPLFPVAGQLAFSGGTLRTTAGLTLSSNRGIAINGAGGAMDVATGTTTTYNGTMAGTGTLIKAGLGTLDLGGASVTVGGVTISAGTLKGPGVGGFVNTGDWTNNASAGAFVAGSGTVTFSGSASQTAGGSFPTTFQGITLANASGLDLGADATVNGILTLTLGNVDTAGNALYVASGGSVVRVAGWVVGNLKKYVATGAPSRTFEVGDATTYAPVTVSFASVTGAGDLTVSTAAGDHPAIGASTLDPSRTVNRFWTLANGGVTFTTYNATFVFVSGDLDPGVVTSHLVAESYSGSAWTPMVMGVRTAISTQATGITGFGDFAIGELGSSALDHFVVTAPASAAAGVPIDVSITAFDSIGNIVTGYTGTASLSSSDAYAAFSPSSYAFMSSDAGTVTLIGAATLYAAGSSTVTATDGAKTGTSGPISVSAGAFAKLLVLVPGETAAPGSPTGRIGTPSAETANNSFSVTVQAVDAYWNPVSATDTVAITSSDPDAALPPSAALVGGTGTFSVTPQTGGPTTITATDVTDGSKTSCLSSAIPVTNSAPTVGADSYTATQDNTLVVGASGVLSNDADPEGQAISVAAPRPVSGPSHGTLTLNADGSFTYSPDAGYSGTDTFTYAATDGYQTSSAATVTITVTSTAYTSSSGWSTSFSASRFLSLNFPAYVPSGSIVAGATFTHTYRSETAGTTTCYYIAVYQGATLLATHGSAGSPVSCNNGSSWTTDVISLPEVNTVAEANNLTVVLYVDNSGGGRSLHRLATVGVDYSLP